MGRLYFPHFVSLMCFQIKQENILLLVLVVLSLGFNYKVTVFSHQGSFCYHFNAMQTITCMCLQSSALPRLEWLQKEGEDDFSVIRSAQNLRLRSNLSATLIKSIL